VQQKPVHQQHHQQQRPALLHSPAVPDSNIWPVAGAPMLMDCDESCLQGMRILLMTLLAEGRPKHYISATDRTCTCHFGCSCHCTRCSARAWSSAYYYMMVCGLLLMLIMLLVLSYVPPIVQV
jgi:hypothetical protein